MSAKNRRDNKKIRKLERVLRKGRLPARLDLVHWLEDHGHANTTGQALSLIYDGRVVSESHTLRMRYVPASIRPTLKLKDGEGVSDDS